MSRKAKTRPPRKPSGPTEPDKQPEDRNDLPKPVDVLDGIPDRTRRPARWWLVVIVVIFLVWLAFLIYVGFAGRR